MKRQCIVTIDCDVDDVYAVKNDLHGKTFADKNEILAMFPDVSENDLHVWDVDEFCELLNEDIVPTNRTFFTTIMLEGDAEHHFCFD